VQDISILSVSTQKDSDTSFIIDNDALTTFKFEGSDGRKESPAKVLLDLKKQRHITRINLFDSAGPNIREVLIRGGATQRNMKTLLSQRAYQHEFDVSAPNIQYIEIYLWGDTLRLDDVRIYQHTDGWISFEALPNIKYQLLYGGDMNTDITFTSRISTFPSLEAFLIGKLAPQQWNKAASTDIDADGIYNHLDNCPMLSNPSQKDSDEDLIGDECDNAPEIRNKTQEDTDYDDVADIIDNCKLEENLDQKDSDEDGVGDVCDAVADAIKNPFQPFLDPFVWSIIGGIVFMLLALWQVLKLRKKSLK
jgi:hypothetical protein